MLEPSHSWSNFNMSKASEQPDVIKLALRRELEYVDHSGIFQSKLFYYSMKI